jgi:hypothetical protein
MSIRKQVSGSVKPKNGVVVKSSKSNKTVVIRKVMPIVEEALYNAEVVSVEIVEPKMTKLGLTDRIRVGFRLDDGKELYSNFLLMWHENQPAYQLIMSVLGTLDDIDLDDLIGAEIRIEVKHNATKDGVFANVVSVYSVDELEDECDEDIEIQDTDNNIEEYDY